jgi:hypothetical protein
LGGVQLAQDLPSHVRTRAGMLIEVLFYTKNLHIPGKLQVRNFTRRLGPGGAEGALQELQVPVRERRVSARVVHSAARRKAVHGAGARRRPLAGPVVCVRRLLAAQEPGHERGPAGAGAHTAALLRPRRVVDHRVLACAVGQREPGGWLRRRGRPRESRWGATAARLHRLTGTKLQAGDQQTYVLRCFEKWRQ